MLDVGEKPVRAFRSIDTLVKCFETGGGAVSLFGEASLTFDAGQFRGNAEDLEELQRRSVEVLGLLASRRPRPPLPSLTKFGPAHVLPLSVAQEPWARIDEFPLSEQWLPMLWSLTGELNVLAFQRSYAMLLDVHTILRTRIADEAGQAVQRVMPAGQSKLRIIDLGDRPEAEGEYAVWRLMKPYYLKPTRLDRGPVRLVLFKMGDKRHLLAGFVHHVAFDGRSQQLFLAELMGRYYGYVLGTPVPEQPGAQYSDFVQWELQSLPPAERTLAAAYWEYKLAAASPLRLPGGRKPGDKGSPMDIVVFNTSDDFYAALGAFARAHGVTVGICVLTALSILLGRWAGQAEALFGLVTLGRPSGFETAIGCFAQSRPFHLDFADDPAFEDLLTRARTVFAASSDLRRPVPASLAALTGFNDVLVNYWAEADKRSGRPSMPAARPGAEQRGAYVLPSSLMPEGEPGDIESMQQASPRAISRPHTLLGLTAGMVSLPHRLQTELHRNIHIAINQSASGLKGRISYAADRFSRESIVALASGIVGLLRQAMQEPALKVSQLKAGAVSDGPSPSETPAA